MTQIANTPAALIDYLQADATIASMAGSRVFGIELPREEVDSMPRAAVVVVPVGGGFMGVGMASWGDQNYDVRAYGETVTQSWDLARAVQGALKYCLRYTSPRGVLIHSCVEAIRPRSFREQEKDWPVTVSSWRVLAAEKTAI